MQITNFGKETALALIETENVQAAEGTRTPKHTLVEVEGPKRSARRRCNLYYKTLSKANGRAHAHKYVKKVITNCDKCNSFFWLACFNKAHKSG